MKSGKIKDVLIQDEIYIDPRTGVECVNKLCFSVWADDDTLETIKAVEGVVNVYRTSKSHFSVYYDQRYDREYVKKEVEAAILCRG